MGKFYQTTPTQVTEGKIGNGAALEWRWERAGRTTRGVQNKFTQKKRGAAR
jgi:hypothetical protein